MRRILVVALVFLGPACTAFDFPAPGEAPQDASVDRAVDAATDGALDGGPSFLDLTQAAQLCALVFQCPRLGEAIEASLVIPIDTPSQPLNFSACMDWLAGPIDPGRVGLAKQRALLAMISQAGSCQDAYDACPVHPVDAGATCAAASCSDAGGVETCSASEGAFTTECAPPLFGTTGSCLPASGLCVSLGSCTTGLSCGPGGTTLVDCYARGKTFTSYDCTLSGRTCVDQGAAACVVPGSLAAPCPLDQVYDGCNGASVRHCVGGRLPQTELACGPVGRACSTKDGVARCYGAGDTCSPFDGDVNLCDESGITVCVGGRKSSFDCSTLPASSGGAARTCVPASATQTAHCG